MKTVLCATLTLALAAGVVALSPRTVTAAPVTYEIDLSHSAAMFRVKHLNVGYTYGRFDDFAGTFVVDEANPAASSVDITIQVKSVNTNDEKRDTHLRSPDFFSANQFPTLTFKSSAVTKDAEGVYQVQGNLTLHGVTKPATLAMRKTGEGDDPWGNHRIGFEGTTSILRSEFGMNKMMEAVADKVWITLAVEGIRK